MQVLCRSCGFESPDTDHFCRQCGSQIVPDPGRAPSAVAADPSRPSVGVGTGRLAPHIGDILANETERFRPAPQAAVPAPAPYAPAPIYITSDLGAKSKPRTFPTILKGLAGFVLVGTLMASTGMAVFFSQQARHEAELRFHAENGNVARTNANGQAESAWQQMEDAIRLANEAEDRAERAGSTLVFNNEKLPDLGKFAYPNAETEATSNRARSESLSLVTRDSIDAVRTYYEKQLGRPVLQVSEQNYSPARKKFLFQPATPSPILLKIERDENGRNLVRITVFRAPLKFSKPETP